MKVGIDHTEIVTDDERIALANVLDQKISKRQATRQEFKSYIWENGKNWRAALDEDWENFFYEQEKYMSEEARKRVEAVREKFSDELSDEGNSILDELI